MLITFLSDYGRGDDFVGVCHAVMARIAPDVRIIDLTHDVPRHDLRTGALRLRRAAPVAAHLAAGAELQDAGAPLDPAELVPLELPTARVQGDDVTGHVLAIDRFGNVTLNVDHDQLAGTGLVLGSRAVISIEGEEHDAHFARTFTDVAAGELLLYEDAYRTLALAVNRGSAADRIAARLDDELLIRPA